MKNIIRGNVLKNKWKGGAWHNRRRRIEWCNIKKERKKDIEERRGKYQHLIFISVN